MKNNVTKSIVKWVAPLSLAIALSACGSNSDKDNNASSSPSASPTSSASSSSSPSSSPSASPSASSSPSASASGEAAVKEGFKLYEDKENAVSIQYPKDWTLNTSIPGVLFAISSPQEGSSDKFLESINLVTEDLGGQDVTLDEYIKAAKEQLKNVITGFNLLGEDSFKDEEGSEGYIIDYSGQQGQLNLNWRQFVAIDNGKAYIVTFTAEDGKFDKYVDQVEEIVDTLMIG